MADTMPQRFKADLMRKVHNLTSDTIKVALLNATHAQDPDFDFMNDVVANELSGTGYSRQTLGSKTVTEDNTNNRAVFDAADVTFTGINAGTAAYVCIFKDNGGADSANEIICILDNVDYVTNGNNLTVVWSSSGIFYF